MMCGENLEESAKPEVRLDVEEDDTPNSYSYEIGECLECSKLDGDEILRQYEVPTTEYFRDLVKQVEDEFVDEAIHYLGDYFTMTDFMLGEKV